MRSEPHGANTLRVEVLSISHEGVELLLDDRRLHLSLQHFPWFRDASPDDIRHVERPSENHQYWPALDIDIAVESIEYPERYSLVSK